MKKEKHEISRENPPERLAKEKPKIMHARNQNLEKESSEEQKA